MRWGVGATCVQLIALFCGLPFRADRRGRRLRDLHVSSVRPRSRIFRPAIWNWNTRCNRGRVARLAGGIVGGGDGLRHEVHNSQRSITCYPFGGAHADLLDRICNDRRRSPTGANPGDRRIEAGAGRLADPVQAAHADRPTAGPDQPTQYARAVSDDRTTSVLELILCTRQSETRAPRKSDATDC